MDEKIVHGQARVTGSPHHPGRAAYRAKLARTARWRYRIGCHGTRSVCRADCRRTHNSGNRGTSRQLDKNQRAVLHCGKRPDQGQFSDSILRCAVGCLWNCQRIGGLGRTKVPRDWNTTCDGYRARSDRAERSDAAKARRANAAEIAKAAARMPATEAPAIRSNRLPSGSPAQVTAA